MPRRIDIELTSARDDGTWTWRAAGAREPRGVVPGSLLAEHPRLSVGDVVRAEVEVDLEGTSVVAVLPPKEERGDPSRLELIARDTGPLVTSTAPRADRDRLPRRDRDRDRPRREGESGRRPPRQRPQREGEPSGERRVAARPARERAPLPEKPKPKRLRAGREHTKALLDGLPAEQRPIAEQLVRGGLPAVRQAIAKQNDEAKASGKPEISPGPLVDLAERLLPSVRAAEWRDRAEAAIAQIDEVDLRDLRTVVTAADAAARDDETRALAARLREGLAARAEREHKEWLNDLAATLADGRVVRALRLSSRPPKAGVPLPADLAGRLTEAASAALSADASPERWAAVLDALAFAPVRRKVVPASLPSPVAPELAETISRFASRLPEIAHIFGIEAPASGAGRPRPARPRRARSQAAAKRAGAPPPADEGSPPA
jgi:hypothetical protein